MIRDTQGRTPSPLFGNAADIPNMLATCPPDPDDAPILAAPMTPGINQWPGHWPAPFTPAIAKAKIAVALAAACSTALAEVLSKDGVIAGWISGGGPYGRAGFGYQHDEAHQGRGLLCVFAPAWVKRLHPRTAWAATQPANVGSRHVLAAYGQQPLRRTWIGTPAHARHDWGRGLEARLATLEYLVAFAGAAGQGNLSLQWFGEYFFAQHANFSLPPAKNRLPYTT